MITDEESGIIDSKGDKLISAHEKIMTVKFLSEFILEFENLENMASHLNKYIEGKFSGSLVNKYLEKGVFSVADLSRYINRKALPTDERKNFLLSYILDNISASSLIVKGILGMRIRNDYFIDTSALLSNMDILTKIAFIVARTELAGKSFDKIVAASIDGTPFALSLARELELPVILLKYDLPLGIEECLSREIVFFEQQRKQTIYLQKSKFSPGDKILIVDDIIRTGETNKALIDMINECKANVSAIISLIGIGNSYNIIKGLNQIKPEIIILHNII